MKIKAKLTLGVGLLFLLIIFLSVLGTFYIKELNRDTQNILVANYNTLDYSREMMMALDENISKETSVKKFETNLKKQLNNITEIGEKELTEKLAQDFEKIKINSSDAQSFISIRKDLADIMLLNMQAIKRKSLIAKNTAESATTVILITGTICFLLAFTLLLNLPGSIANPIKELSESIKEIAAKNYSQRVNFESHNEFGELAHSFNTMAQKLEEYNNSSLAKLLMEKQRIETLINNMRDPVIGLDETQKIIFINNEALKISGLKLEETIGKNIKDIAIFNDLIRSLIQHLFVPPGSNEKYENKPMKIYADGKESYFEKELIKIEIIPTAETVSKHIGDVILLQNITPFKELDFAKTNFIATVSHELKTPISSIKMSLELLKKGNTNSDQKQLIESIQEDSDRLLRITGELLNMSQVETGNIQLNMQKCRPGEVLSISTEAVKVLADQKEIELIINAEENLPEVKADSEKTAWVLINFLTNAIRYSPEHSKIIINLTKDENGVLFSIKDEGKGIDIKYRDKIFDRYFQIPGSSRTGTGLGLAICKEFIEAQGGKIGVTSEIGMGSVFYFKLLLV